VTNLATGGPTVPTSWKRATRPAAGELWRRVERRVVDLAPLVPFVHTAGIDLVSARTGNYQRSVQLGVLLDQLWVT
jgi:hypothetical protein